MEAAYMLRRNSRTSTRVVPATVPINNIIKNDDPEKDTSFSNGPDGSSSTTSDGANVPASDDASGSLFEDPDNPTFFKHHHHAFDRMLGYNNCSCSSSPVSNCETRIFKMTQNINIKTGAPLSPHMSVPHSHEPPRYGGRCDAEEKKKLERVLLKHCKRATNAGLQSRSIIAHLCMLDDKHKKSQARRQANILKQHVLRMEKHSQSNEIITGNYFYDSAWLDSGTSFHYVSPRLQQHLSDVVIYDVHEEVQAAGGTKLAVIGHGYLEPLRIKIVRGLNCSLISISGLCKAFPQWSVVFNDSNASFARIENSTITKQIKIGNLATNNGLYKSTWSLVKTLAHQLQSSKQEQIQQKRIPIPSSYEATYAVEDDSNRYANTAYLCYRSYGSI